MVTIHEATVEDAERILQVHKNGWLSTYPNKNVGITLEDVEHHIAKRTVDLWKKWLKDESKRTWVAKDEDKIIGFIQAETGTKLNYIQIIYIINNYQGKGIGRLLMKEALGWLGGEKDIEAHVVRYNHKALKFYQSQGFSIIGDDEEKDWLHFPSGNILKGTVMLKKGSTST